MKKKYTIILVAILAIALLLNGCGNKGGATAGETTATGATGKAFIGGDKGIELKFMDGAPPVEVFDSDYPFSVNVRLENVGEYDVAPDTAKIKITGINPADFGMTQSDLTRTINEDLYGAHLDPQHNQITGAITNQEFTPLQAKPITGTVEFNIKADLCYPYGTVAISKICMLEDLLGTTRRTGEEPFCEPTGRLDRENSGAPVKITDIRQAVTGKDKLSFTFEVSHIGEGLLFKGGVDCEPQIANKDKVHVKVETGITGSLYCSSLGAQNPVTNGIIEGDLNLYGVQEERMSVTCTQEVPTDRTDAEKQIKVTLTYDYRTSITVPLKVTHI